MIRLRGELRPLNDEVLMPATVTAVSSRDYTRRKFLSLNQSYQLDFSHSISEGFTFSCECLLSSGAMALAIRPIPNAYPDDGGANVTACSKDIYG